MPWVEETLRHDSFLDDLFYKVFRRFEDKQGNKWWQDFNDKVPKIDLYKITFEKGLFVKGANGYKLPTVPVEANLCITRHSIMRRWDNELLGFAQTTGSVKVKSSDIPSGRVEMIQWLVNLYKELVDYTTVYAYTMERYDGYTHFESNGQVAPVTIMTDDSGFGVLKTSLDIEYFSDTEYYKKMKQSPIVELKMKGDTGEKVASIGKLNYKTNTNWWDDSLIRIKGVFDETSAFFTLHIDSAPAWEDNLVTLVPFFFGNLVMKNATKPNETPIALLGGTQVGKFFDFDNVEVKTETLQPVTRNYVNHPSNGVDSVMLKKTKHGARYQSHYLRWNVPPNLMPPTREEIRLASDDIKGLNPQRNGYIGTLLPVSANVVKLVNHTPNVVEATYYRGCRYAILGEEEVALIQAVDVANNTITLVRKNAKEWSAGTNIKGCTAEQLADITRKYPRAWNYLRFGYYQYDFHPSRYSEKIHASRATVMHPEDGVVGHIPNIVLLPVINIMEGDRLKFPYWCTDGCTEESYSPTVPTGPNPLPWNPVPGGGTSGGGTSGGGTTGGGTVPNTGSFSYICNGSVGSNTVDTEYWTPSAGLQSWLMTSSPLGRPLSTTFWEGRNDWLDLFGVESNAAGSTTFSVSKVTVSDFHKFLWKAIEDVRSGAETNNSTWSAFNTWATTDLSCLTELQRASLFMSTKLKKPVLFFPSSEGYLQGDILDKMLPLIEKVPSVVYDWMDFNNSHVEIPNSGGIVGAWVKDVSSTDPVLKSMVNFEPQLLSYTVGAAKAHRPSDYIKPYTDPSDPMRWGTPVVGGEYTTYYKPEMTNSDFLPYVAAEVAVHEMAHSLSFYGEDVLGQVLHDRQDWLDIGGWTVDSSTGQYLHLVKSNPGFLTDVGKEAPVSDYGCFHPAEDFAEAFMMYVINRDFLRDKFPKRHAFIAARLQDMGINPNL